MPTIRNFTIVRPLGGALIHAGRRKDRRTGKCDADKSALRGFMITRLEDTGLTAHTIFHNLCAVQKKSEYFSLKNMIKSLLSAGNWCLFFMKLKIYRNIKEANCLKLAKFLLRLLEKCKR